MTIAATKNPIRQISTHALTWSATDGVIDETRIDGISTHALTWSATVQHASPIIIGNIISTHALTWSATGNVRDHRHAERHFNSRAHVERDRSRGGDEHSDRKFQLTRSRGARPDYISLITCLSTISTHALTWSATAKRLTLTEPDRAFQLTRSRGARRSPHCKNLLMKPISTHALTWSATLPQARQ